MYPNRGCERSNIKGKFGNRSKKNECIHFIVCLRHICVASVLLLGFAAEAEDCLSCNYDNKNLAFANFSNSDLSGSSFRNAYLMGADFSNATLNEAVFTGAIANSAVFTGARLQDTIFAATELELADFENAYFFDTNFTQAYLVHSRLNLQDAAGAVFCATVMFDATENNRDC